MPCTRANHTSRHVTSRHGTHLWAGALFVLGDSAEPDLARTIDEHLVSLRVDVGGGSGVRCL